MKKILLILCLLTNIIHAGSFFDHNESKNYCLINGILHDDKANKYSFYFEMHREHKQYIVNTSLIDVKTKKIISSYKKTIFSENFKGKVGRAYLLFNPVTASWLLGVKNVYKIKINMLKNRNQVKHHLAKSIVFENYQTGRINGDIKGVFVSGSHAWYSHISAQKALKLNRKLSCLICTDKDGAGFSYIVLGKKKAILATFAHWINAAGQSLKMSQFIKLTSKSKITTEIKISMPHKKITFENIFKNDKNFKAGFSKNGQMYCIWKLITSNKA